jgi:hypothetical protein
MTDDGVLILNLNFGSPFYTWKWELIRILLRAPFLCQDRLRSQLFRHLKLTGLNQSSGFIKKFVDVYTAGKFGQVDRGVVGNIGLLHHFSSQEAIDLNGIALIVWLLKIEGNGRGGRVRIEADNSRLCAHIIGA